MGAISGELHDAGSLLSGRVLCAQQCGFASSVQQHGCAGQGGWTDWRLRAAGMIHADKWHPLFNGKLSSNPLLALVQTPKLGLIQIFIFIGVIEVLGILNSRRADYEPGNFLGSAQWETDETYESYQLKELNNGRLAMFASIGMLTGSYITGKGPLEVMDVGTVVF